MVSTDGYLAAVKRADVVVMTTSLNAANVHIVNDAFLSAMKPNSIFVNIGQGGLVDEVALLKGSTKANLPSPSWTLLKRNLCPTTARCGITRVSVDCSLRRGQRG